MVPVQHHGAQLRNPDDGSLIPLTEDFYRRAVEACHTGGYNAATYELVLPPFGKTVTSIPAARRASARAWPGEATRTLQGAFGPLLRCGFKAE